MRADLLAFVRTQIDDDEKAVRVLLGHARQNRGDWEDVLAMCERELAAVAFDRAVLDRHAGAIPALAQKFADRPGWREEWAA